MPLGFYGFALRKLKEQGKLTEKWQNVYSEVIEREPLLPENYTRLSYIEKTSGAGYVDLGFYPTHNTKVELETMITGFSVENPAASRLWYGAYSQASGFSAFACGCNSANASIPGNLSFFFQAPTGASVAAGHAPEHAHKYHVIQSKEGVYLDGKFLGEFPKAAEEFTSAHSFWLFRTSGWSHAWCYGRFYSFKAWESDKLIFDAVPVYDKTSSKYGFYNKVDKKFYPTSTNSGFSGE